VPFDLIAAFALFAFATSITPGPNNVMLMASGVNFGMVRSVPHIAGISIGFAVMLVLVGLGVGELLRTYPAAYQTLKVASLLYMLWFAWKIATAGRARRSGPADGRPMTLVQAALFQWVNPKAWAMALTGASAYTVPEHYTFSLLLIGGVFIVVGTPCMGVWTGFGVALRSFLEDPLRLRVFNVTMALLLVLSFVPIAFDMAGV
jgi:threonine/homoserine/homoserine lactone efflux protein